MKPPRRRAALAAAAALTALALAGCSTGASTPAGTSSTPDGIPTPSGSSTPMGSAAFTGTWGSSGQGKPTLTIMGDGSFSGSDGCNRLSGKGTVSSDTFTFGPIATTLIACTGVDTWLSKASTAKVAGTSLDVFAAGGSQIGTLPKQ